MSACARFAAVDLGATSGRVMLAEVGPDSFEMRALHRFTNDPVYLWNGERAAMHWDLPGLFAGVCTGLAEAGREAPGDLPIFVVFSMFRLASIVAGVWRRGLDGNASDARAGTDLFRDRYRGLAERGWALAGGL